MAHITVLKDLYLKNSILVESIVLLNNTVVDICKQVLGAKPGA